MRTEIKEGDSYKISVLFMPPKTNRMNEQPILNDFEIDKDS